jgi:two-component system, OmpR family, KDP operon response regulator KdpE
MAITSSPQGSPNHRGSVAATGVRILVIDDELEIQRAIRTRLTGAEYLVEGARTGSEGMDLVARWHPDVVILDLSLPDMDGLEVCRQLRTWTEVPILVLSVRMSDADKVSLLEAGADDYLTKPFSSSELVARVRVALRHVAHVAHAASGVVQASNPDHDSSVTWFQIGDLVLDIQRHRVKRAGLDIHLTPTEYEVLKYLATHAGKVITHRTLLQAVWGPKYETEDHYLHVFIRALRRKIEANPSRPQYLLTEPGVGYLLRSPD